MHVIMIGSNGFTAIQNIKNTLKTFQDIVGGNIEVVELTSRHALIVNEEGKLQGLPLNRKATMLLRKLRKTTDYIVGDAFIVRKDEEGFTDVSVDSMDVFLEYME